MRREFVILRDDQPPTFFYRLGAGLFWECGNQLEKARLFPSRDAAAAVLQSNGKHREGWRILRGDQA